MQDYTHLLKISIVLPIYNEIKNLQKGVLDKVINYARNNKHILEVLVVDDGSTDESVSVIKSGYLGQYPKLRLVEKKHSGKAFTVIEGIKQARGEYVLFSDIDLATPIEELDKFIEAGSNEFDVAIGSRSSSREGAPITRKLLAYGFIVIRSVMIGLKGIKDTQCGFKLFKRSLALNIISKLRVFGHEHTISGSSVGAGFDLEFLFLAVKFGSRIKEIPVMWRHVETKNVNFIKDSIETLVDIARIKYYELLGRYKI